MGQLTDRRRDVSSATKEGPGARDVSNSMQSASQHERIAQRRKELSQKQAQLVVAANVRTGDSEDAASADSTQSQRERLEQRRRELAARQAQVAAAKAGKSPVPTLSLSSPTAMTDDLVPMTDRKREVSSATKDGPGGREASSSRSSETDRLTQRRKELADKLASAAKRAVSPGPAMPALSLSSPTAMTDDLVPMTDRKREVSSATKDGPGGREASSARSMESQQERLAQRRKEFSLKQAQVAAATKHEAASVVVPPKVPGLSAMPNLDDGKLPDLIPLTDRKAERLTSGASKDGPESRILSSEASSSRSTESQQSQKERLAQRRRELEAKKAMRSKATGGKQSDPDIEA